ncbi:nitroreductase [Bradyrhizobium sp. USDA 3686]
MPDAIELLKTRRSVKPREMSGPGPSPAELETILTIGARVPDHGKLAPWRFIIFEGDARQRAGEVIAKVFARKNPGAAAADVETERKRLMDAPLVIGIVSFTKPHPKVPAFEQELSAGASVMNIVTARGGARLRRLLADRLVRVRSRRAGWPRPQAGREARGLRPYRQADQAERRPSATGPF